MSSRRWRSSTRSTSSTLLERILDQSKPPVPAEAQRLHYLLFTPFRYAPPPRGSRFRGPNDPGVFYGADEVRAACAELGYWRWRHLLDTPALSAMPSRPQTVFRTRIAVSAVDLREAALRARSRRLDATRRTTAHASVSPSSRGKRTSVRSATNPCAIRSTAAAAPS